MAAKDTLLPIANQTPAQRFAAPCAQGILLSSVLPPGTVRQHLPR